MRITRANDVRVVIVEVVANDEKCRHTVIPVYLPTVLQTLPHIRNIENTYNAHDDHNHDSIAAMREVDAARSSAECVRYDMKVSIRRDIKVSTVRVGNKSGLREVVLATSRWKVENLHGIYNMEIWKIFVSHQISQER